MTRRELVADRAPYRVVVVGGGFAGLFAARGLRRSRVEITLVDRSEHHLFQPLLYQCATGILSEGQIALPLRELMRGRRNVTCLLGEAVDVDAPGRTVLARRIGGSVVRLPYDDLVVAVGVHPSYFGHDEYRPHAPGMKTLADALEIRQRLFSAFEAAESSRDGAERSRRLTFALVGAGPTGVELAGQIRELATTTLREEFRHIDPGDARVLLFDGGERPLESFGPHLSAKAERSLAALGVEIHMHSRVTGVDGDGVTVRDAAGQESRYDAGTVLWTAGVEAAPFNEALAVATGARRDRAGRIEVAEDLTVAGHPEISVLGDAMSRAGLPGVAEVAMQSGLYAARRIRARAEGRRHDKPFRYVDLGSAAYISRGDAVLSVGPVRVSGLLGWLGWLFIHIGFLTGYRNRVTALLTWLVTFSRGIRRERAYTLAQIDSSRDAFVEHSSDSSGP